MDSKMVTVTVPVSSQDALLSQVRENLGLVVISLCAYILTNNLEKIPRLLNLQLQNSRSNYNAGVVVTSRVFKVLKTIFIPEKRTMLAIRGVVKNYNAGVVTYDRRLLAKDGQAPRSL
jgi:hypothetical protein